MKISEEKTDNKLVCPSTSRYMTNYKGFQALPILQGNPLLVSQLHLHSTRFKPIPSFSFLAPTYPCNTPTSLLVLMRAVHPPQVPGVLSHRCITSHQNPAPQSPSSALICDSSSTVVLMPLDTLPPDSKSHLWKQMKSM